MNRSEVEPEYTEVDDRNGSNDVEEEDTKMPAKPSKPTSSQSTGDGTMSGSDISPDTLKAAALVLEENDAKAHLRSAEAASNSRPGAWSVASGDVDDIGKASALMGPSGEEKSGLFASGPNNSSSRSDEKALEMVSALYNDVTSPQTDELGSGLVQNDQGLVYGEYGGSQDAGQGMAVAFSVSEDLEDAYIPSALEFDPDAKNASPQSPFWSRPMVAFMALFVALAVVLIGACLWYFLDGTNQTLVPDALPERAVVGIAESVAQFLERNDVESSLLEDPTHPYSQALDWIQNLDVMALTPVSPKFVQRYLAAYFYFSTSIHQPWNIGCEPSSWPSPFVHAAAIKESNDCGFTHIDVENPASDVYAIPSKQWLGQDDECLWGGVTCDETGGIRKLHFSGSNMTGTFPEGIAGLPFLQVLSQSHGALTGTLPSMISDMKHLASLELAGNQFTGTIPQKWYASRNWKKVNAGSNKLTGTLSDQISKLKDMKIWMVYENDLVGSIPTTLGDARNLAIIKLSNNQLTGTIPTSVAKLEHWAGIYVARNKLTGSIPTELGFSVYGYDLDLGYNRLNGTIPNELSRLGLNLLDLSNNQLSGNILTLANLTSKLGDLRIENNQFSGELPAELSAYKELYVLTASGNNFTGTVPRKVCNLFRAAKNNPFTKLQLDCAVPPGGVAEISCECCTQCCDSDGMNCRDVS